MPPPCSTRWEYFTKGLHPNPPQCDGRTAGTPHTPMHPCSNPKLFWVQCNFCINRNGGKLLNEEKAWMKSREEQMMHHLKNCCPESTQVWEEILEWKANRKGKAKREAEVQAEAGSAKKAKTTSKKGRRMSGASSKGGEEEAEPSAAVSAATTTTAAPATTTTRANNMEQTKLTAAQLQRFHRVCTIAVATRNLDFSFFQDPVILELFSILRPGVVAKGQLPNQRLLAVSPNNFIRRYAMEQVTIDMTQIVRSLKRYEGLQAAVVCQLSSSDAWTTVLKTTPPSTLTCGGELSCRLVPELHKAGMTWGDDGVSAQDPVLALASTFEAQLLSTSQILGSAILGDERDLQKVGIRNDKQQPTEGTRNLAEDEVKGQQSAGMPYIGSCALAINGDKGVQAGYLQGGVSRAHRILAARWPMIAFVSHGRIEEQFNLLFKDLLSKLPSQDFQEPLEHAFAVLRAISRLESLPESNTPNSWYNKLLEVITATYFGENGNRDKAKALLDLDKCIVWSCWTSSQRALASSLRIKSAIRSFASQYTLEPGFPDEFRPFTNDRLWDKVGHAEALARPLIKASLQFVPEREPGRDEGKAHIAPTMADLVATFASLFHSWSTRGNNAAAELVEMKWKRYEHPWMILAFVFHPCYTQEARAFLNKQSVEGGLFSAKYLSNAILGYTVKYLGSELCGDPPLSISLLKRQASEYMDRLQRGEIESEASFQMQHDWKEYWSFQTATLELSKFVLFLLSVRVQVESVQDMFQGLTLRCLQLGRAGSVSPVDNSTRGQLKEHIHILEKASQPIIHKWRQPSPGYDRQSHFAKPVNIVNPMEMLASEYPNAPPATTPCSQSNTAASQLAKKVDPFYDPEVASKEKLEEQVKSALASRKTEDELGLHQNVPVTYFWTVVLQLIEDGVQEGENQKEEAEVEHARAASPVHDDDDMPQLTVPAYAKASVLPPRKFRRTFRPEQINFDFMKDWIDVRDQPLWSNPSHAEEVISKLKNYRANKIRLADFFLENQVPESLCENLYRFDEEEPRVLAQVT